MDTAKVFERSLSSFWAEIEPQFDFKTERVGETVLRRIVILTNFAFISRNVGDIFQSKGL